MARDFTLIYIEKEDCGGGPVITEAKVGILKNTLDFNSGFNVEYMYMAQNIFF